jgi:hypothetical protein
MRNRYDWTGIDWSLTDQQISEQLGAAESTVRNKRADLGLPPNSRAKRYGRLKSKSNGINWSLVDWSLSERKLASTLNLSRATIRRKKKEVRR